jgi:lipopolysaccharide/colanic/teichoic acid biosynthesis glycosyltransferase
VLKRLLDVVLAGLGLLLLSPLLVVVAAMVKLESRGPVFFRQTRIGKDMAPFAILKFRTMRVDGPPGPEVTAQGDPRITRFGSALRHLKVDELPQLVNVLLGDMSLVGPRPEVPRYVDMYREDFVEITRVRPGMTDLASLAYRNESAMLGRVGDAESEYVQHVLPHKIRLAKAYVAHHSVAVDVRLIVATLLRVAGGSREHPALPGGLSHD